MTEPAKPFRFLTDEEFHALTPEQRADYLVRAQDAIQEQQRRLREHMKKD